jgi:hypothetical protein
VIGLILVVLGIVALAIPSFTYFTTERVADVGFLKIDISRPNTIVFNPIVGVVALVAGIVLLIMGVVQHPLDKVASGLGFEAAGAVAVHRWVALNQIQRRSRMFRTCPSSSGGTATSQEVSVLMNAVFRSVR